MKLGGSLSSAAHFRGMFSAAARVRKSTWAHSVEGWAYAQPTQLQPPGGATDGRWGPLNPPRGPLENTLHADTDHVRELLLLVFAEAERERRLGKMRPKCKRACTKTRRLRKTFVWVGAGGHPSGKRFAATFSNDNNAIILGALIKLV